MKRFVRVCVETSALALGISIVPAAAAAAQAATSAGNVHSQRVTIPAPRLVIIHAGVHAATGNHPATVPPFRYYSASAVASQRAAAVRDGGRRRGLTALAGSPPGAQATAPTGATWTSFPAMSINRQISFFGVDQNLQPPDTQVAAGPGAVVEATNDNLSVWSKTGSLIAVKDLNKFFPVPSGSLFSDPRLLYDAPSSRWLLSGSSFNSFNETQTYLAISASSNPVGAWKVYTVENHSTSAVITDQPMTGVCNDKVVMAWNEFTGTGSNPAYAGAQALVLQKSTLLAGSALGSADAMLFTNKSEYRQVPAQALGSTSTCYMTVNNASTDIIGSTTTPTLGVIAITGTPNGTGGALTQTETDLPIAVTSLPPLPRQPASFTNDTSIDDRMLSAVWQNSELWTSLTDACTPTGDTATRDCLRLDEVSTASATPALSLDTDLSHSGEDLYYPAVSVDTSGDLYTSYTASGPSLDPGAYAVISSAASPGSFSAPVTIAAGLAPYQGNGPTGSGIVARWGDYSAAAPDPSVPGNVWVAGEYAPSDAASGDWGTAVAELSLTVPPVAAVAVAALSTSGVPYAQAPQLGSGWHSLGGKVIAVPAVVASPNPGGSTPVSPLFIAPGTNHALYIRGLSGSWKALAPKNASCLAAAAVITSSGTSNTLTVACEGLNHSLYYDQATVPPSGLPQFNNAWKGLGGTMSAAPAVAQVNATLMFFVRNTSGRIYTRTLATGFAAAPWTCLGQPAAAKEAASQDAVFLCQGTNHGLYMAAAGGGGWGPTVRLSGTLAAGPGVAATSRKLELLVAGSNGAAYEGTPYTGYTRLTGITVSGVEAAALN